MKKPLDYDVIQVEQICKLFFPDIIYISVTVKVQDFFILFFMLGCTFSEQWKLESETKNWTKMFFFQVKKTTISWWKLVLADVSKCHVESLVPSNMATDYNL